LLPCEAATNWNECDESILCGGCNRHRIWWSFGGVRRAANGNAIAGI